MHLTDNTIKFWDINYTPFEFFNMNKEAIIYFVGMNKNDEFKIIDNITNGFQNAVDIELVNQNQLTGENIYLIKTVESKLNCNYSSIEVIDFDFEKKSLDGKSFISNLNDKTISGTEFLSETKAYSKSRSLLIPSNSYACCTTLVLEKGDFIDVSLKSFSPDRPIGITISTFSNPSIFNKNCESIITQFENGWNEIQLKTTIPNDCYESKMNFCLFYWGKQQAYLDDLKIIIKRNSNSIKSDCTFLLDKKFVLKLADDTYVATEKRDRALVSSKNKQEATVFQVVDMGNGKVALQTETGNYVCADRSHNNLLFANRKDAYEWELFEIRKLAAGKLSIKSTNKNFIGPGPKSSVLIDANSQLPIVLQYVEIAN